MANTQLSATSKEHGGRDKLFEDLIEAARILMQAHDNTPEADELHRVLARIDGSGGEA